VEAVWLQASAGVPWLVDHADTDAVGEGGSRYSTRPSSFEGRSDHEHTSLDAIGLHKVYILSSNIKNK
jgi:hypothetical protein